MRYKLEELDIDKRILDLGMSQDTISNKVYAKIAIEAFESFIRDKLISGSDVEIGGIGTLIPYVRKVKNNSGRNFSVRIKVEQDYGFKDELIKQYENDNEIYSRGGHKNV